MNLSAPGVAGFVRGTETYCCEGCANGTGCTCAKPRVSPHWNPSHRGSMEQPEPGQTAGLKTIRPDMSATKVQDIPGRYPSRKAVTGQAPKRKRSVTKQRDSTRQQARGQSEFRGALKRGGVATRVSRTGTKS
jgi:hypothetical protein